MINYFFFCHLFVIVPPKPNKPPRPHPQSLAGKDAAAVRVCRCHLISKLFINQFIFYHSCIQAALTNGVPMSELVLPSASRAPKRGSMLLFTH